MMEFTLDDNNGNGYQKIEKFDNDRTLEIAEHYQRILELLGENSGEKDS